ncbi:hypothetical protein AB0I28_37135 [Phytomonospora sp. NPDC050363]|uniref:hypothetical protein n=1 Tax=Phytomonospora sp. NPDC050363 TaxID=3155642 RepID=UPI0033EDF4CD
MGDAAALAGTWGDSLAYGCRSGGFQGPYIADALAKAISGGRPEPFTFRHIHQCVSLGRKDPASRITPPGLPPDTSLLPPRSSPPRLASRASRLAAPASRAPA